MHSESAPKLPTVFIGSSTEHAEIGHYLQKELDRSGACVATTWDQGIFQASTYTLDVLAEQAARADFAVLVVTGDDVVASRGEKHAAPRDNVIFELGLFMGAIGRERTIIVADHESKLQLPSDLTGLTWLPYRRRPDGNKSAAVNEAALGIQERIQELGPRERQHHGAGSARADLHRDYLEVEIDRIMVAARAQGWRIRKNSDTALKLESPGGRRFTLTLGNPARSRADLRSFAADLRANGLRVSQSVRRPLEDAPPLR
ncbi:TIR domain-containing protein [Leifsonia aquatica]|uniref:TIR domain-containing protein n=1 Tax=Leifsonia aquatica TaxID=144185 RepID=UPI0038500BBD